MLNHSLRCGLSRLFPRLSAGALLFAAAALMAPAASAQGLPASVTGAPTAYSQTAAVDDAWSPLVNPAGSAFVDNFQLIGGYSGHYGLNGVVPQHRTLLSGVLSPLDGVAFSSATQFLMSADLPGNPARFAQTFGAAVRFDRQLAFGAQLHGVSDLDFLAGPKATRFLLDTGFQMRPLSWLAFGGVMENLGAVNIQDRSGLRFGVSVRPLWKYVTVGADARFVAGHPNLFTGSAYTTGTFVPAVSAKVQALGAVLYAGAQVEGLTLGQSGAPSVRGNIGVEVNTGHFGALLMGDVSSNLDFNGGAFARFSIEEFDSVIPNFSRWVAFTLTGAGTVVEDRGFLQEVLSPAQNPVAVLNGLKLAAQDSSVEGVVLRLAGLQLGWGRIHEMRNLVVALREAGKKVVVHMDGGGDAEMYLASAADKVYISPAAGISLDGLNVQMVYVKGALDRVGITAEAISAGAYKSAPRTFTASGPNNEELEVQNAILDVLYGLLVENVAKGRDLSPEEVRKIIDRGGVNSEEARKLGLIDGICYAADVPARIESDLEVGRPRLDTDYLEDNKKTERWHDPERIAVIPIVGEISMGRSGGGGIPFLSQGGAGATDIIESIETAMDDSDISAVVLRIDSPGGDALASDLIWNAVMRLREKKPVIASMGDTAASGGYYIAAGARQIFAEPGTITGSIGVFSLMFNGEQLAGKLGVNTYEVGRGERPGPSLFRGLSEAEREAAQKQVDWIYERFLTAVKEGRGMDDAKLRLIAEGRVWTGTEALGHGLVDELGGLGDAVFRAATLAGLDEGDYEITILSGDNELGDRLSTAVRVMAGVDADQARLQRTVNMILGVDPGRAELLMSGRPLMMPAAEVVIE